MRKLQAYTFGEENAMDILSINMIITEPLSLEKTSEITESNHYTNKYNIHTFRNTTQELSGFFARHSRKFKSATIIYSEDKE